MGDYHPFAEEATEAPTRTIRTVNDALRWGDEWIAAHEALLKEFRRLELKLRDAQLDLESALFLRRHLDPFLPEWLQDETTRNDPMLATLAKRMEEAMR